MLKKLFIILIFPLILSHSICSAQIYKFCKKNINETIVIGIKEFYKKKGISASVYDNVSINSLITGEGLDTNNLESMKDGIYSFNVFASAIDYYFLVKKHKCIWLYANSKIENILEVLVNHFNKNGYSEQAKINILKNTLLVFELDDLDSNH